MPRIVKDADVRRRELLDAARRLFGTAGYDRTSIDQITAEVGVAKGLFYHYFASKQDLLEQLVSDFAEDLFGRLEAELAALDADALTRLRAFIRLSAEMKMAERDETLTYARSLYSDENLRLRHALLREWLQRTEEILAPILRQGADEGAFRIDDAGGTAAAVTSLWFGFGERHRERIATLAEHPEQLEAVAAGMTAVETAMERILGLSQGTLQLGLATYAARMTEER